MNVHSHAQTGTKNFHQMRAVRAVKRSGGEAGAGGPEALEARIAPTPDDLLNRARAHSVVSTRLWSCRLAVWFALFIALAVFGIQDVQAQTQTAFLGNESLGYTGTWKRYSDASLTTQIGSGTVYQTDLNVYLSTNSNLAGSPPGSNGTLLQTMTYVTNSGTNGPVSGNYLGNLVGIYPTPGTATNRVYYDPSTNTWFARATGSTSGDSNSLFNPVVGPGNSNPLYGTFAQAVGEWTQFSFSVAMKSSAPGIENPPGVFSRDQANTNSATGSFHGVFVNSGDLTAFVVDLTINKINAARSFPGNDTSGGAAAAGFFGSLDGFSGTNLLHTALHSKGDVLPTAGVDPAIPAGATWYSFGVPAIDEAGNVAFTARWLNPVGSPVKYGDGLFADGALKVAVGAPVPGIIGATFKKFRDPVISADHLACIAFIQGGTIDAAHDTVVIRVQPNGAVTVLAQEGTPGVGVDGATIKGFNSVSISGSTLPAGILYTGTLLQGTGTTAATAADDLVGWHFRNGVTTVVVREGRSTAAGFDAGETVRSYNLLANASGSPAQGRWQTGAVTAAFNAKSSLGIPHLLRWDATTGLAIGAQAGDFLSGTSGPAWKSFGFVSQTDRVALTGQIIGVPSAEARGVFVGDLNYTNFQRVAYVTQPTGLADGSSFKILKDVVLAATGGGIAFPATLTGGTVTTANDASLWWRPGGGVLKLLAREADPAPGGGNWMSFTSLALPGGTTGPLVLATLLKTGGIDTAHDAGVWGVDGVGDLRLLLREGVTTVGPKTVKIFTTLKAAAGSSGTTRAFNSSGQLAWRATFTDATTAIVVTQVP
jgi:hypothetical protein